MLICMNGAQALRLHRSARQSFSSLENSREKTQHRLSSRGGGEGRTRGTRGKPNLTPSQSRKCSNDMLMGLIRENGRVFGEWKGAGYHGRDRRRRFCTARGASLLLPCEDPDFTLWRRVEQARRAVILCAPGFSTTNSRTNRWSRTSPRALASTIVATAAKLTCVQSYPHKLPDRG